MILVYTCTISTRVNSFKSLANIMNSIPGVEKLSLEKLRIYLEEEETIKESTKDGAKQEGESERKGIKKGASKKSSKSEEIAEVSTIASI